VCYYLNETIFLPKTMSGKEDVNILRNPQQMPHMFLSVLFNYLMGSVLLWEPDELGEAQQNEALPFGTAMSLVPSTLQCIVII